MAVESMFARAPIEQGMYESFYLRAVSPEEPVGAWIRYTVHKRPGSPPRGSLWCTVFDAARGAPFTHKHTSPELSVPPGGWIRIGSPQRASAGERATAATAGASAGAEGDGGSFGPTAAEGACGPARWSLRVSGAEPELRHLARAWLYRAPLPRTKLTSPAPSCRFDGAIVISDPTHPRTIELRGWRGMIGHNWGAEHAERWIWLHGVDFAEDDAAWLDVALGRVLLAGRMTPWLASGALCLDGRRLRLGGLGARGVRVAESAARCSLTLPGEGGLLVEAHVDDPPGAAAGWRYADPDGGEHDVVNCSVASVSLNVRPRDAAARTLRTSHGGAYELGMRTLTGTSERDHGVPLAPFADG
jgi:hypothetical protein